VRRKKENCGIANGGIDERGIVRIGRVSGRPSPILEETDENAQDSLLPFEKGGVGRLLEGGDAELYRNRLRLGREGRRRKDEAHRGEFFLLLSLQSRPPLLRIPVPLLQPRRLDYGSAGARGVSTVTLFAKKERKSKCTPTHPSSIPPHTDCARPSASAPSSSAHPIPFRQHLTTPPAKQAS
jgi:hypothetical protein